MPSCRSDAPTITPWSAPHKPHAPASRAFDPRRDCVVSLSKTEELQALHRVHVLHAPELRTINLNPSAAKPKAPYTRCQRTPPG